MGSGGSTVYTCINCDYSELYNGAPHWRRTLGLVYLTLIILLLPTGVIAFYLRSRSSWTLRVRQPIALACSCSGLFATIAFPLRDVIGEDLMPCGLMMTAMYYCVGAVMAGSLTRVLSIYKMHMKQSKMAMAIVNRANEGEATSSPGTDTGGPVRAPPETRADKFYDVDDRGPPVLADRRNPGSSPARTTGLQFDTNAAVASGERHGYVQLESAPVTAVITATTTSRRARNSGTSPQCSAASPAWPVDAQRAEQNTRDPDLRSKRDSPCSPNSAQGRTLSHVAGELTMPVFSTAAVSNKTEHLHADHAEKATAAALAMDVGDTRLVIARFTAYEGNSSNTTDNSMTATSCGASALGDPPTPTDAAPAWGFSSRVVRSVHDIARLLTVSLRGTPGSNSTSGGSPARQNLVSWIAEHVQLHTPLDQVRFFSLALSPIIVTWGVRMAVWGSEGRLQYGALCGHPDGLDQFVIACTAAPILVLVYRISRHVAKLADAYLLREELQASASIFVVALSAYFVGKARVSWDAFLPAEYAIAALAITFPLLSLWTPIVLSFSLASWQPVRSAVVLGTRGRNTNSGAHNRVATSLRRLSQPTTLTTFFEHEAHGGGEQQHAAGYPLTPGEMPVRLDTALLPPLPQQSPSTHRVRSTQVVPLGSDNAILSRITAPVSGGDIGDSNSPGCDSENEQQQASPQHLQAVQPQQPPPRHASPGAQPHFGTSKAGQWRRQLSWWMHMHSSNSKASNGEGLDSDGGVAAARGKQHSHALSATPSEKESTADTIIGASSFRRVLDRGNWRAGSLSTNSDSRAQASDRLSLIQMIRRGSKWATTLRRPSGSGGVVSPGLVMATNATGSTSARVRSMSPAVRGGPSPPISGGPQQPKQPQQQLSYYAGGGLGSDLFAHTVEDACENDVLGTAASEAGGSIGSGSARATQHRTGGDGGGVGGGATSTSQLPSSSASRPSTYGSVSVRHVTTATSGFSSTRRRASLGGGSAQIMQIDFPNPAPLYAGGGAPPRDGGATAGAAGMETFRHHDAAVNEIFKLPPGSPLNGEQYQTLTFALVFTAVGRTHFRRCLAREFALENLLFLLDCQRYREAARHVQIILNAPTTNKLLATGTFEPPLVGSSAVDGDGDGSSDHSAPPSTVFEPAQLPTPPMQRGAPVYPAAEPAAAGTSTITSNGRRGSFSDTNGGSVPNHPMIAPPTSAATRDDAALDVAEATAARRLERVLKCYCLPGAELAVNVSAHHVRHISAALAARNFNPKATEPAMDDILRLLLGPVQRFVHSTEYALFRTDMLALLTSRNVQ